MALIKIISTGGTIANTGHGLIAIDDVLRDIPRAKAMAEFEIFEATRVRSGQMRLAQWLDVARGGSARRRNHRHPWNFHNRRDRLLPTPVRTHGKAAGGRRLATQA